jgi:uncharacterized protein (TIGR00106 family)
MFAQSSIYPTQTELLSKDVAKVIEAVESTGLDYYLGPRSTSVEGDWGQVLAAIRRCHEAVGQNHDRVITTIVIDNRKNQPHHLAETVAGVGQQLGRRAER